MEYGGGNSDTRKCEKEKQERETLKNGMGRRIRIRREGRREN
jgi:hypothetical protein